MSKPSNLQNALELAGSGGKPLLLDGATGTELERRGAEMVKGVWNALATDTAPEILQQIHEDYLAAGSQIIIANTFSTSRYVLAEAGHGDRFEQLNRNAVRLAVTARDRVQPGAWVAGSISSLSFGVEPSSLQSAHRDYRDQAEIMVAAGVDFIILEMMQDVDLTAAAVRAVDAVSIPCWVGYSVEFDDNNNLLSQKGGLSVQEMLNGLDFECVQAVGIMHSLVEPTGPALKEVAGLWKGPRFAYAHSGGFVNPNWQFSNIISPDAYAEAASAWVGSGLKL